MIIDTVIIVSAPKLDILAHLGRNKDYMLNPPKEHLVEKASTCANIVFPSLLSLCFSD